MIPRSWLFVPADSPEKIESAFDSGADALIFDLENGVAPGCKADARANLEKALGSRTAEGPQRWVRINPIDSDLYGADLACCEALEIDGLVLPKAEHGSQVQRLAADVQVTGWRIHAIVTETAASLFHLPSFQGGSPALAAMSWGIDELAAALGASSKFDADGQLSFTYRLARSLCLAGARAAGVQPVDGVFRDINDAERLRVEAVAARREGFTGKLAVHASQVPVINDAFTPSAEELATAQVIVEAFNAQPNSGVIQIGDRMVERPRLMQARGVIERAQGAR